VSFAFTKLESGKPYYIAGEKVNVNIGVRNDGGDTADARIDIYDKATNTRLAIVYFYGIYPGNTYEEGVGVGSMPNRNWELQFRLTP